ncbi:hypothetical protein KOI35_17835 [Actinoplanes bogorensis]|uniref:Uncharacterized protein n=1 Tax=Paractinoplanes bogorensis TaxID=1610840 RepID=A0ABS5YTJ4_9ACTN|nr:hypothetical protein [Actinoplanes bogorensis]MBU2665370.1 hypothetical protein [Actinoplanes bogorensis]
MNAWQPLAVALMSAVAAISAAIFAGIVALKIKGREIDAQHIRDLESRLSEKKVEMYKPAVELFAKMMDADWAQELIDDKTKQREAQRIRRDFATWLTMYGSADALIAYRNFHQAGANNVPPFIRLRLYAELLLAIRQDIGGRDDNATAIDILALTLDDIFSDRDVLSTVTDDFQVVCQREDWNPPWLHTSHSIEKQSRR